MYQMLGLNLLLLLAQNRLAEFHTVCIAPTLNSQLGPSTNLILCLLLRNWNCCHQMNIMRMFTSNILYSWKGFVFIFLNGTSMLILPYVINFFQFLMEGNYNKVSMTSEISIEASYITVATKTLPVSLHCIATGFSQNTTSGC